MRVKKEYATEFERQIAAQFEQHGIKVKLRATDIRFSSPHGFQPLIPAFMTGRVTGGKRDGFNQSLKRNVFFEAIEELSEHDLERYVCFARRRRDADLRFIFSDPDKIIEAGTCVDLDGKRLPQITYAQWAVEIGFRWCGKELPEDWIEKLTKRKREKKI